jgi:hypothetical protein
LAALVAYVPLGTLWEAVLGKKIASPCGWQQAVPAASPRRNETEPLFDESEAHPDASHLPEGAFPEEPKTAEL